MTFRHLLPMAMMATLLIGTSCSSKDSGGSESDGDAATAWTCVAFNCDPECVW